ncbi:MAG: hypothetical protein KA712_06065 [Myxococcales bacterium]|nr:hypothetical protein [Myxococcales bacterium]
MEAGKQSKFREAADAAARRVAQWPEWKTAAAMTQSATLDMNGSPMPVLAKHKTSPLSDAGPHSGKKSE